MAKGETRRGLTSTPSSTAASRPCSTRRSSPPRQTMTGSPSGPTRPVPPRRRPGTIAAEAETPPQTLRRKWSPAFAGDEHLHDPRTEPSGGAAAPSPPSGLRGRHGDGGVAAPCPNCHLPDQNKKGTFAPGFSTEGVVLACLVVLVLAVGGLLAWRGASARPVTAAETPVHTRPRITSRDAASRSFILASRAPGPLCERASGFLSHPAIGRATRPAAIPHLWDVDAARRRADALDPERLPPARC